MDYKTMPLYQRISNMTRGIRDNIINMSDFRNISLQEYKKVLIGKSNYFGEAVGTEFDFVAYKTPDFLWYEQKHKDDILLACKIIYKTSIEHLDMTIEQDLFKFHSIQALRKFLIIINTTDDRDRKKNIVSYFAKNYEIFLNYPPYLSENINLDKCPLCGTTPSRIEPWFYHEETEELLPIMEYLENRQYFK